MNRLRITIAGMMGVVLACAGALAALESPSRPCADLVLTLALAVLAAGTLCALFGKRKRRAFWIGAALCGWGYLALTFGPGFATQFRPRLATTRLLDALYPYFAPTWDGMVWLRPEDVRVIVESERSMSLQDLISLSHATRGRQGSRPQLRTRFTVYSDTDSFQDIGHALLALLVALLGGSFAGYLDATRDVPGDRPTRARHDSPSEE